VGEEKKLPSKSEMKFGICIECIAKKFIFSWSVLNQDIKEELLSGKIILQLF
jgi:hypothetical protein